MVSLPVRRQQVGFLIERGISQRRACRLIGVARSALKYASLLDVKDDPLIAAMRRLAGQYPRYGYRRIRLTVCRKLPYSGPACSMQTSHWEVPTEELGRTRWPITPLEERDQGASLRAL